MDTVATAISSGYVSDEIADKITKSPVLSDAHIQLLLDLSNISTIAGVEEKYITHSAKHFCTDKDIAFLEQYHLIREKHYGFILVHDEKRDALIRMSGICGALIRNFIDARVLLNTELLESQEIALNCTVLLLPDFADVHTFVIPDWQRDKIFNVLQRRRKMGLQTGLYIHSKQILAKIWNTYPNPTPLLKTFYKIV